MQLTSRFRIKRIESIVNFLNDVHVGRLATIDENGYPQVIPMNFVHFVSRLDVGSRSGSISKTNNGLDKKANIRIEKEVSNKNLITDANSETYKHSIYMHSHHKGEKIENLVRNQKVGFEVDKEICFLPSYYFHPSDASFADTLYTSIVIKGKAVIVTDNKEKALAMNKMMQKYQPEGKYSILTPKSKSIIYLTVIRIDVENIEGKFKIGQEWTSPFRKEIANKIIEREGVKKSKEILKDMKINILENGDFEFPFSLSM